MNPGRKGAACGVRDDELLGLGELGLRLFRAVAREPGSDLTTLAGLTGDPVEAVEAEARRQIAAGLLTDVGGRWEARDPAAVLADRQALELRSQHQAHRAERAALARAGLLADYLTGRHHRRGRAYEVLSPRQMWARLAEVTESAQTDLRFLLDGGPAPANDRAEVAGALVRAAGRGVRVTGVCAPSPEAPPELVQLPPPSRVQVYPHVPLRAVVVDHATALVPINAPRLDRGGYAFTSPGLVALVTSLVDLVHANAARDPAGGVGSVVGAEGAPDASPTAAELSPSPALRRQAICDLLATGARDPEIAVRLGVPVRTIRRDISVLMAQTGTRSRFALGVALANDHLMGLAARGGEATPPPAGPPMTTGL
ncbi:LuxR family transcriptional regulator [Pseudofrankia inefficax]|uniref:Regulatory protein LuxR n=1 Tax=Pseudofrankia inefficax (strain DSM 45817 / CECT 9037 / DDB 130130 / EuI1c) TaxID=298654 RepID=E3J2M9_PSEI1|nr:LuxR family transcriptional regulator [Pseudofrankia inefficax]ADP80543.1 regulatory protein LuxR [Pseudofrankia inefficax]